MTKDEESKTMQAGENKNQVSVSLEGQLKVSPEFSVALEAGSCKGTNNE